MTIGALTELPSKYFNILAWLRSQIDGVHCGNEVTTESKQKEKLPLDLR